MQLDLYQTPSMLTGHARLVLCPNCGTIVYAPSGFRKSRKPLGDCPMCGKNKWKQCDTPNGPFHHVDEWDDNASDV